ncbi:hypothetical protein CEUSTIGMA_g13243.t1, partial [Chlamydomonas eustigma]
LTLQTDVTNANGGSTFCLKNTVIACNASAPCCSMNLNKIEIFMNNNCWGAVSNLTVNGSPLPTSYSQYTWNGQTYDTFKATKLNIQQSNAQGLLICITLSPICPTLVDFCYGAGTGPGGHGCEYAMFSSDQTCCPTTETTSFVLPDSVPQPPLVPAAPLESFSVTGVGSKKRFGFR